MASSIRNITAVQSESSNATVGFRPQPRGHSETIAIAIESAPRGPEDHGRLESHDFESAKIQIADEAVDRKGDRDPGDDDRMAAPGEGHGRGRGAGQHGFTEASEDQERADTDPDGDDRMAERQRDRPLRGGLEPADGPGVNRLTREIAFKVLGERPGRGVPLLRRLLQALHADRLQIARYRRIQPARRHRLLAREPAVDVSTAVAAWNGGRPVSRAYNVAPSAYTSAAVPTSLRFPLACSGGM